MARAPFQVLVIPFKREEDSIKYCIFKRKDLACWQWISGGGEESETVLETAKREAFEEAGINSTLDYLKLDSMASIPSKCFKFIWGKDVLVVPEYSFGVEVKEEIKLSHEHTECKWINYDEAAVLLEYDSNKTALWELNIRLTGEVK